MKFQTLDDDSARGAWPELTEKRHSFSPVFQRMLDEPEQTLTELRTDAVAFERSVIAAEAETHAARAAMPDRRALAFMLFDERGDKIATDLPDWLPKITQLDALLEHVDPRSSDGRLICIARPSGPLFALWAPYSETDSWNLPSSVRQVAVRNQVRAIALFAGNDSALIDNAAAAFGLAPHQQRVVAAVVRTGSLHRAAGSLGITYVAAREAMSGAARRMHLPNTPSVVRTVVAAAFGILPGDIESPIQLADTLCITERQAQIALLIASGASRGATAKAVGSSPKVIKNELQLLFVMLGVRSAAALARFITEAQALRLFAQSIDNAPGFLNPAIEPSRFTIRPNRRGIIAWSDYGPSSGKPVLVVHSNWCCRAVPVPLLRALQGRGWRPIAIDRPGFGATHIGASTSDDPFSQAIDDTLQVLDEMKLSRVPIIARCGAQYVHALALREPELIASVVLVSPTPRADPQGLRKGPVGAFKEAFYRSPRLVQLFFRMISAQCTFERVEQMIRSITKGSPADEALSRDPQFIRDRFRALRPFACGGYIGGIFEELAISHPAYALPAVTAKSWTVLQGGTDYHNSTEEVFGYWRTVLPDAKFEIVPDGGRFMTSSHPDVIVERLEAMA